MSLHCIICSPGATVGGSQWTDLKTVAGYVRRINRATPLAVADIYIETSTGQLVWQGTRRAGVWTSTQWHWRTYPRYRT